MNVNDAVTATWQELLDEELRAIDAETVVGARVVELCAKADELLGLVDEADEHLWIRTAIVRVCRVWYFG